VADLINEVDEELRKDRAQQLWQRYGRYVIAVSVLLIAAVAGYTWFEQQRMTELQVLAERYQAAETALSEGEPAAAAAAFEALAADAQGEGVALLARFRAAAALGESGDAAGAASAFEAIAADSSVEPLYRDLAAVKAVPFAAQAGEDAAVLMERLTPLTQDGAPWRFTARIIAASLAIAQGDTAGAEEYLKQVADDDAAPSGARGVASEILNALGS
jgi:hypothetical protein